MFEVPKSRARLLRSLALDAGFATAEFAVVLPAVIFMGAVLIWALSLCVTQLQIESAAYSATRELIRGDKIPTSLLAALPPNSTISQEVSGDVLTVSVSARQTIGIPGMPWSVELQAHSIGHLEHSASNANM
jgi:hypothetical protein